MCPPSIAYWKTAFHRLGSEYVFCKHPRYKFADDFDAYLWSSVDHLIPYAARGVNHPDNLVPCCIVCNMYKKEQIVDEPQFSAWIEEREVTPGVVAVFVRAEHFDDYIAASNGPVQEFTCTFSYEVSTPTPTPTPTATPTATLPPSPTSTPTSTPRPTPTPRSQLTPRGRPTPPPRPSAA